MLPVGQCPGHPTHHSRSHFALLISQAWWKHLFNQHFDLQHGKHTLDLASAHTHVEFKVHARASDHAHSTGPHLPINLWFLELVTESAPVHIHVLLQQDGRQLDAHRKHNSMPGNNLPPHARTCRYCTGLSAEAVMSARTTPNSAHMVDISFIKAHTHPALIQPSVTSRAFSSSSACLRASWSELNTLLMQEATLTRTLALWLLSIAPPN